MSQSSRAEDLARRARFVFRGRVRRLRASTMTEVPATNRTAVVGVDEILQAPDALRHYAGKDVTVQVGPGQKLSAGQDAVFYANPWLFGKSVAVHCIGQQAVVRAGSVLRRAAGTDPVRTLTDRDARAHFDAADVVVSGKVRSVRLPEAGPTARALTLPRRPSEHDPMWREAVVEVDDVHQGHHARKTIVVRFPGSRDVMWSQAPKLRPGQEGYFVLHRSPVVESPPVRARARAPKAKAIAPAAGPPVYALLHADDFEAFARPRTIHALIRASSVPAPR